MNKHPIDSGEIRKMLAELNLRLDGLSLAQNDQVCYLVSDICLTCEKAAFYAGLQAGTRLAAELNTAGERRDFVPESQKNF